MEELTEICRNCNHPLEAHDRYDYCPWISGEDDPMTRFDPIPPTLAEKVDFACR